jgi:hypothetical protein
MLIVEATINMTQSLCTSAFEGCHVNRLIVFAKKIFSRDFFANIRIIRIFAYRTINKIETFIPEDI